MSHRREICIIDMCNIHTLRPLRKYNAWWSLVRLLDTGRLETDHGLVEDCGGTFHRACRNLFSAPAGVDVFSRPGLLPSRGPGMISLDKGV